MIKILHVKPDLHLYSVDIELYNYVSNGSCAHSFVVTTAG